MKRFRAVLRSIIGFAVFLAAWQLLAQAQIVNPILLPSPLNLLSSAWELLQDGSLVRHVGASLQRVLAGFVLACIVGIALGVLLGWFETLADFVKPIFEALRPIPPIAWTPLAILWFGIGNAPSYFLVFIGAVFPVLVNTFAAVRNVERTQINAALCLGATPRLLIFDVLVPASLPIIFPGLRIALGVGWMCVVAAELIAAQSGLGYMIQTNRVLLKTDNVMTGMIAIGVIGFLMNGAMSWIERRLIPWKQAAR
jgi:NitT/TauT family transport system permease protein/sulfonate transport system permease protein